MPSNYSSLAVTWYDATDTYSTSADITNDVKSIPIFTDTGTGEVNQARIVIRALEGKYITSGNIIDIFDRFHILCTDLAGNSYSRFFEVIDIIPSQTKSEGSLLTLDCLGIEYHTQQIHVSKPYYFESAFNVVDDLGDMYNENKGSAQPTLGDHNSVWDNVTGNDTPKYTSNNYEYGIVEDSVYNRMMDVVEKLGASVSAGGALTFYELSFLAIVKDAISLRLRKSGDNTPSVTIKNAKVTNPKTVGEQEGMLSNPTGTNVLAWGSPEHGTLPVNYSKYFSGVEFFRFRPEWDSTLSGGYPADAIVKVTQSDQSAKHYISLIDGNLHTPGNPSFWTQIDMGDSQGQVNGDSVQYSPWTDGKAQHWKNAMANPSGGTQFAWDSNIVIWDEDFFRTWVNARAKTDSALNSLSTLGYAYTNGDRTTLPRGFRVLVDGTGSGDLSDFSNMVAEWTGSEWRKKYSFTGKTSDVTINSKVQIAVLDEGKIYEDTITAGPTHSWSSIDNNGYANDCFHPVTSVTNEDGFDQINQIERGAYTESDRPDISKNGSAFSENIDTALKFTYQWGNVGTDHTGSYDTQTGSYYQLGGWANFQLPYPVSAYNSLPDSVGDLYKPATLDIQNMHNTSNNNRGFNQGDESEDLGTINGVAFWIKLSMSGLSIDANDLFRVFMIDTSDNIIFADFNIEHRDHWEDIRIPISSFRPYRGRRPPYAWKHVIEFVPPKELDNVNQFEWRNVKFVGIQWQLAYDDFGRYNPTGETITSGNFEILANAVGSGYADLYIDAFRFTKPLLVTSGQDTTRNLEPNFLQRPNISNYWQLKNDVKSQLEIEKFKHKEYNIESSGDDVFDIKFGDSFLLENDEIVNVPLADREIFIEDENKIRLVAKRIEYSITKPQQGPGGLRRRINGSKVFT